MIRWLRHIFHEIFNSLPRRRVSGLGVFYAAPDMTQYDRIREMVHWADEELDQPGIRELTLDLSRLVHMDTSFLAGVILVCRRARVRSITVRIVKMPKRFETMVDLYRIRSALIEAGVVFQDDSDFQPPRPHPPKGPDSAPGHSVHETPPAISSSTHTEFDMKRVPDPVPQVH